MPRKATTRKAVQVETEPKVTRSSLFDYLRFGESYTSLILGIIVVIISTVLLLSFVHNKNTNKNDNPQLLSQKDIALPSDIQLTGNPSEAPAQPTAVPTKAKQAPKKVAVAVPTATPTPKLAAKPTATPTLAPMAKATPTPAKLAQGTTNPSKTEYIVAPGDNLWTIAEKTYKSGYNWVDIARVNNLSNPRIIHTGDKLKLPKVEEKLATVGKSVDSGAAMTTAPPGSNDKIIGTTYTTVKGDTLWNISVRAYGDGFQWQRIASANNLSNPRLIHSGNVLKIPRG